MKDKIFIKKKCEDCSTIMLLLPRQGKRTRCEVCRKLHAKKVQKEVNQRKEKQRKVAAKKKLDLENKKRKDADDAWDCIHRNECLIEAPIGAKYLPCHSCDRYSSAWENVTMTA